MWFSLQETYEAKRKEFLSDLQHKEEEMRQMFVSKVKETEAELKDKEREVRSVSISYIASIVTLLDPIIYQTWCLYGAFLSMKVRRHIKIRSCVSYYIIILTVNVLKTNFNNCVKASVNFRRLVLL